MSNLDNASIGIAALRMQSSLGMSEARFGLAAGVCSLGLVLFSLPSSLALMRFGARAWLSVLVISWAFATAALGLVRSTQEFILTRFLLGCAQAGLFPCLMYYMSIWVPASWRARTVTITGFPFAMIFGVPLSGALMQHFDGSSTIEGWRAMFVVEGVMTALFAIVVFTRLTPSIQEAQWLSESEKVALASMMDDRIVRGHGKGLLKTTMTLSVWVFAFAYFLLVSGFFMSLIYIPKLISSLATTLSLRLTIVQISLLAAIPFSIAGCLSLIWTGHSDRTGERALHCAAASIIGAIGICIAISASGVWMLTAGLTVCVFGVWSALSPLWPLALSVYDPADSPTAVGIINAVGTSAGFFTPLMMGRFSREHGNYNTGLAIIAAALVVGGCLCLLGRGLTSNAGARAGLT